ncbi:recombinase family protein, partial [Streptomyces sp. NPDC050619]|uniref:recombinase family protein n=1 Tax=Streptomyces sp. NPDC050619 TaxID=3157214 RepID=UPI003430DA96
TTRQATTPTEPPLLLLTSKNAALKSGKTTTSNTLAGLDAKYPRAWACLAALSDLMASDGDTERAYSMPRAPVPVLPGSHETIHAEQATSVKPLVAGQGVVASGVDPRFDQALLAMMQQVKDGNAEVVPLSALSRLSRNSDKQLRVLDFLLAHGATVLTTNYLLSPDLAAVRTRPLVKPDSYDPRRTMKQLRGLGPTHTGWIKALRKRW